MSFLKNLLGDSYKEGMTEEEISTALESVGIATSKETDRLKGALSKANSEAAEFKKQLRSKQSADEAAAAARQEEWDNLAKENAELKRSIALSVNKGKLIAMGYDEKLADDTAIAMVDGDMDKVMANQSKYIEAQRKVIQAEHMRATPRPAAGVSDGMHDYSKQISDAQARGDIAAAAYYTRLQAQESVDNN